MRLTIQRQRDSRHVEIQVRLHDDDGDEARGRELPRCAWFSFDHGRDADLHLSGVGFVVPDDDGRVSFTTGQGGCDQSLGLHAPVIAAIVDEFGLVIEDRAFDVPIGEEDLVSPRALFDPDRSATPF